MESWEHIAPELPPTGAIEGSGENLRGRLCGNIVATGSSREWLKDILWDRWGTPRKRWAELIAVERVREAAEAEYGYDSFWVDYTYFSDGRHCLLVSSEYAKNGPLAFRGQGPTICDAAWECIQALGGGE